MLGFLLVTFIFKSGQKPRKSGQKPVFSQVKTQKPKSKVGKAQL
jgi:hypothetical protein